MCAICYIHRCIIMINSYMTQYASVKYNPFYCPTVDAHLSWPPKTSFSPPFLVRGMHSRWAALNRCHCELETDGNEGSLQSGSPAAVLCTRCQGVMTAQQGGTQRYTAEDSTISFSLHPLKTHKHICTSAKVQIGRVLAPIVASRNMKVEV